MSAASALQAAREAGIHLRLDGGDLVLEAATPPPATVLDLISRYKVDVIALLLPGRDGWSAEDWRAFYDERAGIAEFDGRVSRAAAECTAAEIPLDPEGLPFTTCPCCDGGDWWKAATMPPQGPGWACTACTPPPADLLRHACAVPAAHDLRVIHYAPRQLETDDA